MELDIAEELNLRLTADPVVTDAYFKDFAEGLRLYDGKQYVEALLYFIEVWQVFTRHAGKVPTDFIRDVEYFMYKAWVMSSNDLSRALVLPTPFLALEGRIACDGNSVRRSAVRIVSTYGRSGLRLHDFIERRFS